MANTSLMVKVSPEFKAAVEQAAHAEGVGVNMWARKVLAEASGYDLSKDSGIELGRPKKYANNAERNKARAAAQRARVARDNAILTAVMRQERLADIDALEKWLVERGINLDDEPVKQAV